MREALKAKYKPPSDQPSDGCTLHVRLRQLIGQNFMSSSPLTPGTTLESMCLHTMQAVAPAVHMRTGKWQPVDIALVITHQCVS